MSIKSKIRSIKNYPKEGIVYRDITTLLKDKEGYKDTIDTLTEIAKEYDVDLVLGIEARGFIVGAPVAYNLNCGFVPVRKSGKLPMDTLNGTYELEYGHDELEIHIDAIEKGQKVIILDDLLATGGTSRCVAEMVEKLGGKIEAFIFLSELSDLNGRKEIEKYDVRSIIKF
ncbi:MAG: adenine phosphoribosyltransferase [Tissierellia bacterium]|nr:adenine phosphoribosyltransferase [Tissierellia bacterium]